MSMADISSLHRIAARAQMFRYDLETIGKLRRDAAGEGDDDVEIIVVRD